MTDQAAGKAREEPQSTRGLLRHSLVYGLVPLIRYATSIGMTHFYTRCLITALYGVRESVELGITLMQQLLGINLFSGMTRIYFERQKPEERASVVTRPRCSSPPPLGWCAARRCSSPSRSRAC